MPSESQKSANEASYTIAPNITRASTEDESRPHGAAKMVEATPVVSKYDVRTTNVTEDLEDRFDKQLDCICDSMREMLWKQVFISQKQRDMQQGKKQPEMTKEGPLIAEVDKMLEQVSEKGVVVELLHKILEDNRKVLTAAKRTERQSTLEEQMMRNKKEMGEVSQRMEEEQARIEQRRRENEDLQREIAWLTENEGMGKGGNPTSRLNELVEIHEELRMAIIGKSRSRANLLAQVESGMFMIQEDDKELMRWETAKIKGETGVLERRLKRCERKMAEVSGEAIKRRGLRIQVHEREAERRQVRVLECKREIEAIQEIQRRFMLSLEQ